jgi:hypothetical protein
METDLNQTDARQGDRRKMNMVVLFWSLPAAIVLLAIVLAFWAF